MAEYIYQPALNEVDYEAACIRLRERVPNRMEPGWANYTSPSAIAAVMERLCRYEAPVVALEVGRDEHRRYLKRARYGELYSAYYTGNLSEKSFEHLVSIRLLAPSPTDVFVDIASEGSPLPEIVQRLHGCMAYAQDIMYPAGVNGARIGGDACAMPVPDGFASRVALTCSLEHFEGDGDTRLFQELARILRRGGKVAVVPLYLMDHPAVQTDPVYSVSANIEFDPEATVYCGNRHGRFYSPETLLRRIFKPVGEAFSFSVHHLGDAAQIDASIYARFALLGERR
jgi:hypothetical protein